jgi:hypothetical protein
MDSRRTAQVIGICLALAAAGAAVWAFGYTDPPAPVPSFALQSSVVYRAETALALVVAAGVPLLFIGRLVTGRFPDRISTQGAEWREAAPDLLEAISELRENVSGIDSVTSSLVELLEEHETRMKQAGI